VSLPALLPVATELARRRFGAFVHLLGQYNENWHHRLLIDRLQQLSEGRLQRLIVSMPPQHGKSELVCRRWPAWLLGRRPTLKLILCTHTATLAEAHSRQVQRLLGSPLYRLVFPEVQLPAGRGQAGRYKRTDEFWELPQGGYLRAAGVGGAITGLRFDIGIIDDPVKSWQEAESPAMREAVWQWYTHDFLTRRSRDARIVVVMTRWHRDDLVGRLLRQQADQWEVVQLPALLESANKHPEDPRSEGEALWPDFLSAEQLQQQRRNDPRAFAALYQQEPSEAGGVEWPDSYFGDWLWLDQSRWPPQVDRWVMAIDPSRGRTDAPGDYAAIVLLGHSHDKALMYVEADLAVRTPEATIRRALELWDQYRPVWIAIESNQFHGLLERDFQREAISRLGMRLPIWPILNTEPKLLRIRRIGPLLANRELRFRQQSPGCQLLVDQLRDFPLAAHDDGPDALEMALRILTATAVLTPERAAVRFAPPESVPLH